MHITDYKKTRIETFVRDIPLKKRSLDWKNSVPLKKRPLFMDCSPPYSPTDRTTDFNLDSAKHEKEDPCHDDIDAKPTTSELESFNSSRNKSHWDLNTTVSDWGEPLADKGMYYAENLKHIESIEDIDVKSHECLKLQHSLFPATPLRNLCVTEKSSPRKSCKTLKSEAYKVDGGRLTMENVENRDEKIEKSKLCDFTPHENQTSGIKNIIIGSIPCDLQLRIPNTDGPNCIIDERVESLSVSTKIESMSASVITAKDKETSQALTCTSILDSSLVSLSPKENSTSSLGNIISDFLPCDSQLRIPNTDDLNCKIEEHVESMSVSAEKDTEICQVLTGSSNLNSDSLLVVGDFTDDVFDLDSSVRKIVSSSNSGFCDDEIEDGEVRDLGMKNASFSNVNTCLVQDESVTESCLEKEKLGYFSDHCAKDVVCETFNENHTEVSMKKISNECNSALTAVEPTLNSGSNESSSRVEKKFSSSRIKGREYLEIRDQPRGYENDRNRDGFNRKSGYKFQVSRGRLVHNINMEKFHGHRNHLSPEFRSEEFDRCSRISSEASFEVNRRGSRGNFLVEDRTMRHMTPGSRSYVHRSRRCSISPNQRRIPFNIPYMRSPRHRSPRLWSSPRRLTEEFYKHSELIPCRFERAESPVGVDSFPENSSFVPHRHLHQEMRQMGYPTRPEGSRDFQRNMDRLPPRLIGRRVDSEDRNFNGHRGFVHSRSVNHMIDHGSNNPRNFRRPAVRYRMGSEEAFPHRGGMQELGGMHFNDVADDNNSRAMRLKH